MSDHYFNALEYAHQLEEAGVPTAQAEVHANALALVLENCLSSSADLASMRGELLQRISAAEVALRAEIKALDAALRAEIKALDAALRAEIKEVEVTLRARIKEVEVTLRAEIKEAETRVRADLTERIDRLEERMEERFRWQWWANGVMVAMLVGLYFR